MLLSYRKQCFTLQIHLTTVHLLLILKLVCVTALIIRRNWTKMNINQNLANIYPYRNYCATETLILQTKLLFFRNGPLIAIFHSYKHLPLFCANSLVMEHALSYHMTFHGRVPSAGFCVTPPLLVLRHGGCWRSPSTEQTPHLVCSSTYQAFFTLLFPHNTSEQIYRAPLKVSKTQQRVIHSFFSKASDEKCCFNST